MTQISDLLSNTSAINFVDQMGQVHGSCVRQGIFSYVGVALSATSGGTVSAASGSILTFADVTNAIKHIAGHGYQPDFIVTSPSSMWTAFTTTHAVTQFYGALNDLIKGGIGPKPKVLGLEWYADPYFDTLFPAGLKRLAYVGCKGLSSIWAALQNDPLIEIYRVPTELSNYLITVGKLIKKMAQLSSVLHTAYVAGLFDGEGCVMISKSVPKPGSRFWRKGYRSPSYNLKIGISNNYLGVLEQVKRQYGGSLTKHISGFTGRGDGNTLIIGDNLALAFLKDVREYLVIKKEVAEVGIDYQETKRQRKGKGKPLLSEELERRESYRVRVLQLNHHKHFSTIKHLDGGAAGGIADSICGVTYAS